MRRSLERLSLAALGLVAACSNPLAPVASPLPPPVTWVIQTTDLGTLGGSQNYAMVVNSGGSVGGASLSGSDLRATTWSAASPQTAVDVGGNGGDLSVIWGMNASGISVGVTYPGGTRRAFRRSGSTFTVLGTRAGGANAISTGGTVVGSMLPSAGATAERAFRCTGTCGTIQLLQELSAGRYSAAMGVNDDGRIVGVAENAQGQQRAVMWESDGVIELLPTLGGASGVAYSVNAKGNIVGSSENAAGQMRPFVFFEDSTVQLRELPTLGGTYGTALSINGSDQIVGYSGAAGDIWGTEIPFVWMVGEGSVALSNQLGGNFGIAMSINDNGYIAGYISSSDPNGPARAVRWRAVKQ